MAKIAILFGAAADAPRLNHYFSFKVGSGKPPPMRVACPPAIGSAALGGAPGSSYLESGVQGRALAAPSPPACLFTAAELGFHPDLWKSIIRAVGSGKGAGAFPKSSEQATSDQKT